MLIINFLFFLCKHYYSKLMYKKFKLAFFVDKVFANYLKHFIVTWLSVENKLLIELNMK